MTSSESAGGIHARRAVWLASAGIGLLFLARGAFQPYAFPLFEHLGALSYAQIALTVNAYVAAQSIFAPIAGWYADRTSVRTALVTSILLGSTSFLAVAARPGALAIMAAVFVAGVAFVLGKIALNTILVLHSTAEGLRRSVAKRATLLNLGSFSGNSLALAVTTRVGYGAHVVLLGLLHLPLAVGLLTRPVPRLSPPGGASPETGVGFRDLLRHRGFLADSLRRLAMVLPYGCWGTIIPKFVIDRHGATSSVWLVYLTSVLTTVIGAHFVSHSLPRLLYRRGFRWESWPSVSIALYCTGLGLLALSYGRASLILAVVVFICGEVVMTPCFDEAARKYSGTMGMGRCMGLLHLVDGAGRMLGAAFALAMYGSMRGSRLYWPVVIASFATAALALHIVARWLSKEMPDAAVGGSVVIGS